MKCTNCGFEFSEGIFCPECGFKNSDGNKKENSNNIEPQKSLESNAAIEFHSDGNITGKSNGFATASLIMGIISILTVGILFIPEVLGIIFAFVSKKGGSMIGKAKAGLICSIVSIVILIVLMMI